MAMLTSGEMIRHVADVTGFPEVHVLQAVRVLRTAGLLTKKGRGTSAARLKGSEMARLLIALMVTDRPTQAAQAATDFGVNLLFDQVIGSDGADPGLEEGTSLDIALGFIWNTYVDAPLIGVSEFTGQGIHDVPGFNLEIDVDRVTAVIHHAHRPIKYAFHHATQVQAREAMERGDLDASLLADEAFREVSKPYFKKIRTTRSLYPNVFEELAAPFRTEAGR
jgi:hypothetical protein